MDRGSAYSEVGGTGNLEVAAASDEGWGNPDHGGFIQEWGISPIVLTWNLGGGSVDSSILGVPYFQTPKLWTASVRQTKQNW